MRTPLLVLLFCTLLLALPLRGSASPAQLCETAAQYAAERTGVPLSILRAVTLAETGRAFAENQRYAAWPWAIQSGNRGNWFLDSDAALTHVKGLMAQGVRNIDIGCFQLNLRWHGQAFENLEEMISPQENAIYAARFLQKLFHETGDWRSAVGRYHSRDTIRAQAYVARLEMLFKTHLAAVSPAMPSQNGMRLQPEQQPRRFGLAFARGPIVDQGSANGPIIRVLR